MEWQKRENYFSKSRKRDIFWSRIYTEPNFLEKSQLLFASAVRNWQSSHEADKWHHLFPLKKLRSQLVALCAFQKHLIFHRFLCNFTAKYILNLETASSTSLSKLCQKWLTWCPLYAINNKLGRFSRKNLCRYSWVYK